MVNKRIVDYLKYGFKKGYTLGSLKNALIKQGQSAPQINEAIKYMQSKKSKKNILLLFAILILFFTGIFLIIYQIKSTKIIGEETSLQKKIESCVKNEPEVLACKAFVENKIEICENISVDSEKFECLREFFFKKAINEANPSLCEDIKKYSDKKEDIEIVYGVCLLASSNNSSYCNLPPFSEDVIRKEKCNLLLPFIKDSSVAKTSNFDSLLSREEQIDFYQLKALVSKNSSFCQYISISDKDYHRWVTCLILSEDKKIYEENFCKIYRQHQKEECYD